MTQQLLSLDTLVRRPKVAIDGTQYEMLSPDEMSVLDYQRFGLWHRELVQLQEDGGEDDPALEALVDRIARKAMVGVPAGVIGKLSGAQKIAVVEVFTGLLLQTRMRVAGATATAMGQNPSTGESYSRGLAGSTAGARASGWRTRLSRWFGSTG